MEGPRPRRSTADYPSIYDVLFNPENAMIGRSELYEMFVAIRPVVLIVGIA